MPALKPRPYYQTIAQFREFDRAFPVHKLNWAVPDLPSSYLHFHNGLEFGYCRSGQGIFVIADKVRPFRAGDVSVIDRSERHYAQSAPGVRSDWTWAQMDAIALLAPMCRDMAVVDPSPLHGPLFPNIFSPASHPVLCELVRRFFDELWASRPHREVRIRAIVLDTMVELRRMEGLAARAPMAHSLSSAERIAPALEHIASNYAQEVRVERLAGLCNLGATQFRRQFAAETGKSPQRYIIEMRVGMACAMLAGTSRPISRVAAECGFVTLSSFNRAFRAVTGASPREWRRGK
jgi:AraC-like DNA-binding protein